MKYEYGAMVECYWQEKADVSQKISYCHFVNHKIYLDWPEI
jgi:hypothetical protein